MRWNEVAIVILREIKRLEALNRVEGMLGTHIQQGRCSSGAEFSVLGAEFAELGMNVAKFAQVQQANTGDTMDVAAMNVKAHHHLLAKSVEEWREHQIEAELRLL